MLFFFFIDDCFGFGGLPQVRGTSWNNAGSITIVHSPTHFFSVVMFFAFDYSNFYFGQKSSKQKKNYQKINNKKIIIKVERLYVN